ncbi:MAG: SOS response-associated peptidase [Anaerolineales bacterium]|nr:SOS response-associated peptidase [Anaerolineales bacterium]
MCGRFALLTDGETLIEQFEVTQNAELLWPDRPVARYNIAPTQPVAAIRTGRNGEGKEWALFGWGLVPSWAKEPSIGSRMINARSETVAEKPSFRAAYKRRRCLVPMDGFYEWQKVDGGKQPHFIHMRDKRPFAVAGLWEFWESPDGSALETCTLLTTTPNELMAELHNRMPVILDPADYNSWLFGEPGDGLQHLLRPCPAEQMTAYPVSRFVNSPYNDAPECIAPFAAA